MHCAVIWDLEACKCVRFFWLSRYDRALRMAARYRKVLGDRPYEVFVESAGCAGSNLDNAVGCRY